jgi:hypothetical protein
MRSPTMRSIYVVVDFRMLGRLNISKQPLTKDEIACHEREHVVRKVGISMSDSGSPISVIDASTSWEILVLTYIRVI